LLELMREAETRRVELYERTKRTLSESYEEGSLALRIGLARLLRRKFRDPELQALSTAFDDRLRKIEKAMKRYRWTPTVGAAGVFGLRQAFIWRGRRDSGEFWENAAVLWLLGHVNGSGRYPAPILRFRQCRQCSEWFYAMTDHQVSCSTNCRQKAHADNPLFRAKRAQYMREKYRPHQKEAERKAREGVRYAKAAKARVAGR
jgi:hypothetical protein